MNGALAAAMAQQKMNGLDKVDPGERMETLVEVIAWATLSIALSKYTQTGRGA